MNKKWNKKSWYAIIFLSLSVLSFLSQSFWMNFYDKISTTNILHIDYFMRKTLKLGFTSVDIFLDGPLILGAIFLLFAMFLAVMGEKQSSDNNRISISLIITAIFVFFGLLFSLYFFLILLDFGVY